jgi:NAD dependent epimerase/dehydratase family enzyme
MVTLPVAGGTGKLGLTIVEVLKQNPKHKVIILSRKVRICLLLTQDHDPSLQVTTWLTKALVGPRST